MATQDCQDIGHGNKCAIPNCKCECHFHDNTKESPNLQDYKSSAGVEKKNT